MQATEAADQLKEIGLQEKEATGIGKFENQAALLIAFLAMLLAITSVAGSDNMQVILQGETEIANTWAFFQAKNIRRTSTLLAKDQLELQLATAGASWTPEARRAVEEKIVFYNAEADRYRNEPEEGTQDLQRKARALEEKRELAVKKDPNFDFAEGLFQIAIVIASVSIVTKARPLLLAAGTMGVVALVLMLNGFFLLAELPF